VLVKTIASVEVAKTNVQLAVESAKNEKQPEITVNLKEYLG